MTKCQKVAVIIIRILSRFFARIAAAMTTSRHIQYGLPIYMKPLMGKKKSIRYLAVLKLPWMRSSGRLLNVTKLKCKI